MSMYFGPVRQVGHVVRDSHAAMEYWTRTLGIGPFFVVPKVEFVDYHYRGHVAPSPVCTLCFAQSGDVQIELIEQHNDAPSAYREFLSAGRSGVQHISPWFSDTAAYEAGREKALAQGLTLVHESRGGPARFCYFETGTPDAPLLELSEALLPGIRALPDMVAEAARGWNGEDPIRIVG
jgi:catechol 2,3-dioxygenase-like lactoylglutathione lyase family enzyme